MTKSDTSRVHSVIKIDGNTAGQVAVGNDITQNIEQFNRAEPVTDAELVDVRALISGLRAQVAANTPPEFRDSALERIDELAEAVTADQPELGTARYVLGWFRKKVPALAGAVRDLVLNPLVSRIVGAAGEVAAADFQHFLHDMTRA
jgi:hypothetical protein